MSRSNSTNIDNREELEEKAHQPVRQSNVTESITTTPNVIDEENDLSLGDHSLSHPEIDKHNSDGNESSEYVKLEDILTDDENSLSLKKSNISQQKPTLSNQVQLNSNSLIDKKDHNDELEDNHDISPELTGTDLKNNNSKSNFQSATLKLTNIPSNSLVKNYKNSPTTSPKNKSSDQVKKPGFFDKFKCWN